MVIETAEFESDLLKTNWKAVASQILQKSQKFTDVCVVVVVVVSVNCPNFVELYLHRLRRITFRFYLFKRILLTKFALRETKTPKKNSSRGLALK